ncbi:hypothetical protein BBC0178_012840 [Bartonella apihabitans]|uniref:Serine hydrolase n=1 Tax=Bartonella apihabitans TaxID=2750929 RepID=A0A1U9MBB8_9HYPH|nr:hypothetical protein BBC0178_012840 [Bartonella apihabitans]
MRVNEVDILIVPGYQGSGPDHWQTRWEQKLSTAHRVEQAEWSKPVREDWTRELIKEVEAAQKPVVIVAHSLGVPTSILSVPFLVKKCGVLFSLLHLTWQIPIFVQSTL